MYSQFMMHGQKNIKERMIKLFSEFECRCCVRTI